MIYVLAFVAAGAMLVVAGSALTRHADVIATESGLGRIWIGSVLIAVATSLPELATGIAAVRFDASDLAVGELFGSNMANMLILATLDLLPLRKRLLQLAALSHVLSASFAIGLTALAAVLVIVRPAYSVVGVSPWTCLLAIAYVSGMRAVYHHERRQDGPVQSAGDSSPVARRARPTLRRAALSFAASSLIVLVSAPAFAWGAQGLAALTGLGDTFVGTWLVGLATSLPEMVACLAAVRMGAIDLAVGGLFGSNAFNMTILLALDVAQPGSLFVALDPNHALSGLLAVLIMAVAVAAIVYRSARRYALTEPNSLLVAATYVLGLWLLYAQTTS